MYLLSCLVHCLVSLVPWCFTLATEVTHFPHGSRGFSWGFWRAHFYCAVSHRKSYSLFTEPWMSPPASLKSFSTPSHTHIPIDRQQMLFVTPAKFIYFNMKSTCSWWIAARKVRTMGLFRGWWLLGCYHPRSDVSGTHVMFTSERFSRGKELKLMSVLHMKQGRLEGGRELGDRASKGSARCSRPRLLMAESESKEIKKF